MLKWTCSRPTDGIFTGFLFTCIFNPLSANPTKWSNTPKQFVSNLGTNCLSVFDHFVKLALKRLMLKRKPVKWQYWLLSWCHFQILEFGENFLYFIICWHKSKISFGYFISHHLRKIKKRKRRRKKSEEINMINCLT